MVNIFVSVAPVRVEVGHLFLQLVAFAGHDCLTSGSLPGDLLCVWLLGSPFLFLPSEGGYFVYILFPGV